MKKDVQRLTAEKDNIARYGVGEVYTNFAIASPSKGPYRTESASHLSDQEAKFERVARRARERLVEQESMIDALKSELSKAQDSLRSVQLSQPEDVFSTRYDTSGVLNQNRTVLGVRNVIEEPCIRKLSNNFTGKYTATTLSSCRPLCRIKLVRGWNASTETGEAMGAGGMNRIAEGPLSSHVVVLLLLFFVAADVDEASRGTFLRR